MVSTLPPAGGMHLLWAPPHPATRDGRSDLSGQRAAPIRQPAGGALRSGVPTARTGVGCDSRAGADNRWWHADLSRLALQHRSNPARQWLLEIVGFWTPDYVARKLALYRSARLPNLILCIDEDRNCADADLPPGALVVNFRRRVDAAAVLRVAETTHCPR